MFAPVVNRFHVYDIPVSKPTRAYMETMMALPAWKAWIADAHAEPWRIERYEHLTDLRLERRDQADGTESSCKADRFRKVCE